MRRVSSVERRSTRPLDTRLIVIVNAALELEPSGVRPESEPESSDLGWRGCDWITELKRGSTIKKFLLL